MDPRVSLCGTLLCTQRWVNLAITLYIYKTIRNPDGNNLYMKVDHKKETNPDTLSVRLSRVSIIENVELLHPFRLSGSNQ